jgi:large subunit ribosomal protein L25
VNQMADEIALDLEPRVILGKKVKTLRRNGIIPVHVYGAKDEPEALQCERAALEKALSQAGSSTPIFLGVEGKPERQLAMVREVQVEPVRGSLLHVDFLRVEAAVSISADVPLVFEGESPGARAAGGNVAQVLYSLAVQSFPLDIPSSLSVDLSTLTDPQAVIRAQDVVLPANVTLDSDPQGVVARIDVPQAAGHAEAAEQTPEDREA